jgi:hypothetical protein
VGDKEQIDAFSNRTHITDLYYTTMDGTDDYLPEFFYGRFSATNDVQLQTQMDKTMAYYNNAQANKEFFKEYTLVAGADSSWAPKRGWPQINYAIAYYFNKSKGHKDPVKNGNYFLSAHPDFSFSASDIVNRIDERSAFFNYTAHGSQTNFSSPSFTISNINSLKSDSDLGLNPGRYVFIVGNCCLTGSFQVGTCFGEAWLRAAGKGAIGFAGGSNYTYWDEDLWFGVGADVDLGGIDLTGQNPPAFSTKDGMYLEARKKSCNAAVVQAGNLAVTEAGSSRTRYYWEVYHLFGCPSLPAFWADPPK